MRSGQKERARSTASRGRFSTLSIRQRDQLLGLAFVAPAVLSVLCLIAYPVINTWWIAMHDVEFGFNGQGGFVGLQNLQDTLKDAKFWKAASNTVVLTGGSVVLQVILGVGLAVLLNQPMRGARVVRSLFLLPWALPTFVAAFTWTWILHPHFGVLNGTLRDLGMGWAALGWLSDPSTSMLGVILAFTWKGLPWVILVALAGLQSINPALVEAARVDGASAWRVFWHITLPGLRYVLIIIVLLRGIWTFNTFEFPYLLTGGGPLDSTNTLALEIYNRAFVSYDFGHAAAIGVLMFVILAIFITLYFRILGKSEKDV